MPTMGPRTRAHWITGEHIQDFRYKQGLNQDELALKLGISAHSLSFLETGRSPIDRRTELAICFVAKGLADGPACLGLKLVRDRVEEVGVTRERV